MNSLLPWRGVRLRVFEVGEDADAPTRRVAVPASWDEAAAAGFVGLLGPPVGFRWEPARLPDEAERWIAPLDRTARRDGLSDRLGLSLQALLLFRQAAPDEWAWRGGENPKRSFLIHLASFADPASGLDIASLDDAVETVATALSVIRTAKRDRLATLRLAGLDGLLAALGLAYDSENGRDIASDVIRRIRDTLRRTKLAAELAATEAGAADALLGVETAGVAPPFSPVGADGSLTLSSERRLAARGLSPERALALTLGGDGPLNRPGAGADGAMAKALDGLLDRRPVRAPITNPAPAGHSGRTATPARPRRLPARAKGFTEKVVIGGQRVFLRTAEFEDGALGEMSITAGGSRPSLDMLSAAISVGLQHGVSLAAYADLFAGARFGAQGPVEGDGPIAVASSPLDWALRALSDAYDGRRLPDPLPPIAADAPAPDADPLLPMTLPRTASDASPGGGPRRRHLRLVSAS